jgi:hypothetical protein
MNGPGDFTGPGADELRVDLAAELDADARIGISPYAMAKLAWGDEHEPALFSVQHVGRTLILRPVDDAARDLLAALPLRAHVEVKRVGEVGDGTATATEAGRVAGWGAT